MDHKEFQRLSDSIAMQSNTFAVLMGDDKTVVTRGCTALENEDLYKCDMHTAGNQASGNGDKRKTSPFQVFTFCNCHGNGCNKDWDTAGEKSSLEVKHVDKFPR